MKNARVTWQDMLEKLASDALVKAPLDNVAAVNEVRDRLAADPEFRDELLTKLVEQEVASQVYRYKKREKLLPQNPGSMACKTMGGIAAVAAALSEPPKGRPTSLPDPAPQLMPRRSDRREGSFTGGSADDKIDQMIRDEDIRLDS